MVRSACRWKGSSTALFAVLLTLLPAAAANEPGTAGYDSNLRRKVILEGAGNQRFGIEERMRHYGVPAVSVAVVDGCEIVDSRAFGQARPDGTPAYPGTRFMAGSVSKVVASAGALKLVEDGTLSLDDDVSHYLGGWTLPRPEPFDQIPVTLRQLLSHSAGLTVPGFKGYAAGTTLPSLTQILDGTPPANTDPVRIKVRPGADWRYSGGGFVLTQLLMEEVSHIPFQDLIRDRVLRPAGMHRSGYHAPLATTPAPEAASGTLADGTQMPGGWRLYPEQAAAGLWSTPTDLSHFGIALVRSLRGENGALLTKTTANEMMRRQAGAWGLGVELSPDGAPRKFSHTGAPVGYRTLWLMFPDTCQGATIMTNADEGMTLAHEVARAIADQYGWPDPMHSERASFVPLTDAIAARFTGTYQLRDFPAERFEVERLLDGTVTWARQGRGRKALAASGPNELLSPDSGMRLVALDRSPRDDVVTTLELRFPGGVNIAQRVEVRAPPEASHTAGDRRAP
jgi:CubicO group peptidase (beta-lactamase class C family)